MTTLNVKCPNCKSTTKVSKHCTSPTCTWHKCLCERTIRKMYLIFDNKKGKFLTKDKF